MSEQQTTLEVRLADQTFRLTVNESQTEILEQAVALFNEKFTNLRREMPTFERNRLSMILGLEFAQEILKLNQQLQAYGHFELALQSTLEELDHAYPEHLSPQNSATK